MNSKAYKKNIDINFKDLLWNLLTQWKAILIVALLIAVAVCGVKHIKDVQAYDLQIIAQKEAEEQSKIPAEERIESLLAPFSETERAAISYVLREQMWVDEQKSYFQDSILVSIDPTNQKVLKMVFDIDSDSEEDRALLCENYSVYLQSDETSEKLKTLIRPNADNKYISELFFNSEEEGDGEFREGVLSVNMVLPEDTDSEAVGDSINSILHNHSKQLQPKYAHTLSLVTENTVHMNNQDNVLDRMNVFTNLNSIESIIKNTKANMSEEQIAATDAIIQIRRMEKSGGGESASTDAVAETSAIEAPKCDIKYAFFGFIIGVLIYAFVYSLLTLFKNKVSSASSAKDYTQTRLLGEAYYDTDTSGLSGLFHSKAVDKIRYSGKEDVSVQIDEIVSSVNAVCRHKGIEEIALFDMTQTKTSSGVSEIIDAIVAKADAKCKIANAYDDRNKVNENIMTSTENAILVIGKETNAPMLRDFLLLCKAYDITVIGSIYISEK